MALIRFPEGQQRSGSAGGTVYSHNRYGAYIRARSIPVNPNTPRQVAVRARMQSLSIAWQTVLTPAQRDAWEVYGSNVSWQNKFGETVHLPGLNHFVRSNAALLQAGIAQVNDAPTIFTLATPEIALEVTGSEGTQVVTVSFLDTMPWCAEDDAFQSVFVGLPKNPSTNFFGGPWRFAGVILGDSAAPIVSPQTVPSPYPIAESQKVWVRTRIGRADGRLSEVTSAVFLCAA